MRKLSSEQLIQEFERQSEHLYKLYSSENITVSGNELREHIATLRNVVGNLNVAEADLNKGYLPFVIVVKSDLINAEKMMMLLQKGEKHGVTILRPHTSLNFKAIRDLQIPAGEAYILADIDRGRETLNVTPKDAMTKIVEDGRSPLTIDEGIACVTQFPEFLMKNNCFSLLASRTGTDKRVPAIWINSKKEPNLGWCWEGNPHTWLGTASAKYRFGTREGF